MSSTPAPSPPPSWRGTTAIPAALPAPEEEIITIRGVRAERLGAPRSAELDDIIERPAGVQVEERDGVLRIVFPDKPRVELRKRLKRARFRWNAPAWEARAVAAEVARDAAGPATTLNVYEEQRLARVERMKTKAERTKQEAGATIVRAREMGKVIPFGEPIHVGTTRRRGIGASPT